MLAPIDPAIGPELIGKQLLLNCRHISLSSYQTNMNKRTSRARPILNKLNIEA